MKGIISGMCMEAISKRWVIASGVTLSVCGCSMFNPSAELQVPADVTKQAAAKQSTEETPAQSEALTAVANFLERTRGYDTPTTMARGEAKGEGVGTSQETSRLKKPGFAKPRGADAQVASGASAAFDPPGSIQPNTHMSLDAAQPVVSRGVALPVVESVTVHVPANAWPQDKEVVQASLSNQGLDTAALESQRSLASWLSELESRVEKGEDFDAEWQLRLAQLALNRDQQATSVSHHLPQPAGEILRSLIEVAIAARRTIRDPNAFGDDSLGAVEKFKGALLRQANPEVAAVALCRKVITFGVYEEMDPDTFVAGRPLQAIVYTEVENLRYEKTPDGRHRTLLGSRLELLTADGQSVWHQEEPEIVDLCRRRRNDFFVAQRVTFPPTLRAGEYVLKVAVEDKLSGRTDEASYPLTIVSQTSVAQRR